MFFHMKKEIYSRIYYNALIMWTSGWIVALATMVVCVIAQHLGLTEAISSVLTRISKCYRCVTFWGTLMSLLALKKGILEALFLSILMSYLSNFFALSLVWMQRQYNILWEKVERGKRRSGRARSQRRGGLLGGA